MLLLTLIAVATAIATATASTSHSVCKHLGLELEGRHIQLVSCCLVKGLLLQHTGTLELILNTEPGWAFQGLAQPRAAFLVSAPLSVRAGMLPSVLAVPTHFLAMQVSTPCALHALERVQACLLKHSPGLYGSLVDPASAHLTLCVMTLPDATVVPPRR